ncbi:hypothetical protein GCM10022221_31980 [Actinocorallia aurea]
MSCPCRTLSGQNTTCAAASGRDFSSVPGGAGTLGARACRGLQIGFVPLTGDQAVRERSETEVRPSAPEAVPSPKVAGTVPVFGGGFYALRWTQKSWVSVALGSR